MILQVPYAYSASFLPTRHRNAKPHIVLDTVAVEIAEISSSQAPVVLRSTYAAPQNRAEKPKLVDYRAYGGRLWTPYFRLNEDAVTRQVTADAIPDAVAKGYGPTPFRHSEIDWHFKRAVTVDSLGGGRFVGETEANHQKRSAAIVEEANDLLLIDGKLCKATPEPLLFISYFSSLYSETRWSIDLIDIDDVKPDNPPTRYFRADRLDDARNELAELRRKEDAAHDSEKKKHDKDKLEGHIKVLRPEFLQFRYDMKPRVELVAKAMLKNIGENMLKNADVPFFTAYAHLRDAMGDDEDKHKIDHAKVAEIASNEVAPHLVDEVDGTQDEDAASLRAHWIAYAGLDAISDEDVAAIASPAAA